MCSSYDWRTWSHSGRKWWVKWRAIKLRLSWARKERSLSHPFWLSETLSMKVEERSKKSSRTFRDWTPRVCTFSRTGLTDEEIEAVWVTLWPYHGIELKSGIDLSCPKSFLPWFTCFKNIVVSKLDRTFTTSTCKNWSRNMWNTVLFVVLTCFTKWTLTFFEGTFFIDVSFTWSLMAPDDEMNWLSNAILYHSPMVATS